MDSKSALEAFAQRYVVADFRDRFLHEALKRPEKLHSRICHSIGDLFPASLAGAAAPFSSEDPCLVLEGAGGFRATTWAALPRHVGLGEGLLVVGSDGSRFYAETEAMKGSPSVVYGHGS
ncbi:hypothetical protein [Luteimonas notoginsengisoli]|uniref:Uncharacterized protein n=1 Tax=Luteimonas notoginsengisoli TaxID=1578200 RepID=A0ABV7UVT7_9GAMM